jgi:ABC-type glutathione transport system ATPase component
VDGVDLEIPRGETLGLVGESGCGKSTLGRAVVGLTPIRTGSSVRYGGREVAEMPRRERTRRMQIVFQDPYSSLNPKRTVGAALVEPLAIHDLAGGARARRERARELLDTVGLPGDSLRRYPREFSGGQRQRIAIARALAVEPELVVLDECVSSLDVSVQAEILNLLLDLQAELSLTYLFVSHDLSVVRQVADRVAVMATDLVLADLFGGEDRRFHEARDRGGHIVEHRPAERLFEEPEHPYTRRLLAAVPGIPR